MSLAARCPSCGTVFRVQQDQLDASDGWVRCGRCEEVFSALKTLFDLEREPPPPWPAEAPARAGASGGSGGSAVMPGEGALLRRASPVDGRRAAIDSGARRPAIDPPTQPATTRWPASEPEEPTESRLAFLPELGDEPDPAFLRGPRRTVWDQPRVRLAAMAGSALLALLLLAQFAVHWRDPLAARWPAAQPLLQAVCAAAGCRIEPLRRIESLVVDSSGLLRAGSSGNLYRLSVVLRNRDSVAITLPALDLVLTDAQGSLVARKVLQAAELGAPQPTLAAGAELALQGLLDAGERSLAGYTVEIFYP